MKFEFDKKVSKLLDFLVFPRIYFFIDEVEDSNDEALGKVIKEEHRDFQEKMKETLKPHYSEINKYYQKDIYSHYDFANILISAYPVYDYTSIESYYDDIRKENPDTFKSKIIRSLVTLDDEVDEEKISFNIDNPTEYINELKVDSANKWNLFMMIQNPRTHFENFVELLAKLEPYFNDYYKKMESKIEEVGNDLSERLSENTEEVFKKLTFDSIKYDFNNWDSCSFYVSAVFPYTLRFVDSDNCRIVWGYEMEYGFAKIHEIYEDRTNQRVKIFKSLGDKTRYETLKLLAKGESSIKNIADALDVSSATISYHINEFLTSGIVYLNRDSNKKFDYRVDYDKLNEVINFLKEDLNF
jgi:DNA-binding transcriptional ArsR family regulator